MGTQSRLVGRRTSPPADTLPSANAVGRIRKRADVGAPGKGRTPHQFAQAEEMICKKVLFDSWTRLFHQDQVSANTREIVTAKESSERKFRIQ
jgi:hypothetical protein